MKIHTLRSTSGAMLLCCVLWYGKDCLADTNTISINPAVQVSLLMDTNMTCLLQQSTNLDSWVTIEQIEGKRSQETRFFTTFVPTGFFRAVQTNAAVQWLAPLSLTGRSIRLDVAGMGTWTLAFTSSSQGNDGNPGDPYSAFAYTYYRTSDRVARLTKLHIDSWLDVIQFQFQTQTNGTATAESYDNGAFVKKGTATFVVLP